MVFAVHDYLPAGPVYGYMCCVHTRGVLHIRVAGELQLKLLFALTLQGSAPTPLHPWGMGCE